MFANCKLALSALFLVGTLAAAQQSVPSKPALPEVPSAKIPHPALAPNYGKLPLAFEANQGQVDSRVRFTSRGNGYSLFLTDKEAVLALSKGGPGRPRLPRSPLAPDAGQPAPVDSPKRDVVRMQLAGAAAGLKVSGDNKLPGTANYFIGNDPAKWHSNVPTYGKVRYEGVYPGVDLVYYGNQSQLEYDFVVAPHADPKTIRLRFAGAKRLKLDSNGDLEVIGRNGEIAFHKPVVYQQEGDTRRQIEGKFSLLAKNTIGFSLDGYDTSRAVVIDPTLVYSTYLGGSYSENGDAIVVDSTGDAYVVGSTGSFDFPVSSGALEGHNDGAFVTKINATGSGLIYSTHLGGDGPDTAVAIAIDSSGNAYVAGNTDSSNFPTTSGSYQSTPGGSFISKLGPGGSTLLYSTYLGGSGGNSSGSITGMALDSSTNVYVAGVTIATQFPTTPGAFQTTDPSYDSGTSFVAKLNASLSALTYSTYLGGSGGINNTGDAIAGIAVDSDGYAYVTGGASSIDFPITSQAFQQVSNGQPTAFISKINQSGSGLVYSTYLGGSGNEESNIGDRGQAIAVDKQGNAYVAGFTDSKDFPVTAGAYQSTNYNVDSFVTKLDASGSTLIYSTLLGGAATLAYSVAIDNAGDSYVTGTNGYAPTLGNFPVTPNAFQSTSNGPSNAFVSEFNPTGSSLVYSSLIGGSAENGDIGNSIAVDSSGNCYITGTTYSSDFPVTSGAFQTMSAATKENYTAFVAKFALGSAGAEVSTSTALVADQNPQSVGINVTFTADVTPSTGSGVPTGTVGFTIDGGTPVVVTLDGTGHASYATSSLTEGVHSIVANYSGDSNYAAVASATLSETILGSAASIAVVSGSSQTTAYGLTFASPLVVIVKDANGNALSGISVGFSGTGLIFSSSTATTGSNGEASVMASAGAVGNLTATASTSGVTGTASFALTATKVALTVTAANASVAYNQSIPALTYSITGFVNGDTSSAVTGTPTETTTVTKGSPAGAYPITVTQGTLASSNYSFGTFTSGTLTITSLGTAATPAFSSAAGTYTAVQTVTITDATTGATIYYTTNGTTPTTSSTKYTGAITVSSSETVEAIAIASGYTNSAVASAAYVINLPAAATPAFSLAAGTYTASQTINITDATSGASIYYTTNGTAPTTSSTLYAGAITVSATETIEAIAVATGYTTSAMASATYTITPPAAMPVISPVGGTYTSAQTVTITDVTSGSTIYYTTNGTAPTTSSTAYTGAITVNASETVEAIATAPSYSTSAVATAAYVINLPAMATPTFSPVAGTYTSAQSVTISDATTGAAVYYTTDGTAPTTSSSKYTGAITVGSTETIEAIAAASGDIQSAVATAVYTINIPPPTAATPTFSPIAGTYTSVQAVTITDATVGAAIYYTLDGSTPSATSPMYSSPISVGSTETINASAVAVSSGYASSAIATAAYTINLPAASFTLAASPSSVSVASGQSASVRITVTPENRFTSQIAFTCSGLPTGAECSFAPATITPAGAAVTSSLSIMTSASAEVHPFKFWSQAGGGIFVALMLWPFAKRRRLAALMCVVFLLIAGGAMLGCGGGSSAGKMTSTTYPVTITATGGGATETASISLTVTN